MIIIMILPGGPGWLRLLLHPWEALADVKLSQFYAIRPDKNLSDKIRCWAGSNLNNLNRELLSTIGTGLTESLPIIQ